MDKKTVMTRIAAIVSSLGDDGTPESMLYIFCDMNMQDYEIIRDILVKANLVSIRNHFVTLTQTGKETADKLNALIKN
jgi:hypothetical protein